MCSERFPQLFSDPSAKRICDSLDYDFAEKRRKMDSPAGLFGALEVAQRQYDLRCEVEAYLRRHPKAAVVNLMIEQKTNEIIRKSRIISFVL